MKLWTETFHLPFKAGSRTLALTFFVLTSALVFAQADPPIPSGDIRIHYHRPDGSYSGWTVYAFDNTTENTGNYGGGPVLVTGTDSFGTYFDVGVTTGAQEVGIIIHNPTAPGGDQKDTPNNLFVDPATQGDEYWAYSGIA
jgi:pullulanase